MNANRSISVTPGASPWTRAARVARRAFLGSAVALAACGPPPADRVFTGGTVYTADAEQSRAEAVAVRGERIVYVGSAEGAQRFVGEETDVVELEGRMLLPAFRDAHVHAISAGIELGQCDLNDLRSLEEIRARVAACAEARGTAPWIVGGGFDLGLFPGGAPGRQLLDSLTGPVPTYLSSADGHSAWVNTAALAAAGIDRSTPDPDAGVIVRDASGAPQGTLRETATDLVSAHLPPTPPAARAEGLRRALERMGRFGIVSFQEASASEAFLETYHAAATEGWLTARVRAAQRVDRTQGPEQVDAMKARRERYQAPRLSANSAKIFVDGVIEGGTAALLEPYLPLPGEAADVSGPDGRGLPNYTPDALTALVARLDAEGFQVHMHAIGDRGIRMALDALEAARASNGVRDARHHLAHIQLVHPDDRDRFAALDAVANVQPLWSFADAYMTELTEPRLGPERSAWQYPLRSLADSGARLAAGSDWSVSSLNPLDAIQVAVTHRSLEPGPDEPVWNPDERVDLPTVLDAYTRGGAWVNFEAAESGSIEPGKLADLIVLDRDLFGTDPVDIHRARVLLTLLEGELVFRDPALGG
ncbi:MAG: amidohydrolase family protein [Gemmatimonadota bacterium]